MPTQMPPVSTVLSAYVHEYVQLDDIENEWLRSTFQWMLVEGLTVTQCGSNVFQIRKEKANEDQDK